MQRGCQNSTKRLFGKLIIQAKRETSSEMQRGCQNLTEIIQNLLKLPEFE